MGKEFSMRWMLCVLLFAALAFGAEEKKDAEAPKKVESTPDIVFRPGTSKEGMELADGKLTFGPDGTMKFEGSVTNCATMLAFQMPLISGDDPLAVGAYELHFRKDHSVALKKTGLHFKGKWDETAMVLIEKAYRTARVTTEAPKVEPTPEKK